MTLGVIKLPNIGGFEVVRRIRLFRPPTSFSSLTEITRPTCSPAPCFGADGFITKPFRRREMRARVAAMMRQPRRETQRDALGLTPLKEPRMSVQSRDLELSQRCRGRLGLLRVVYAARCHCQLVPR